MRVKIVTCLLALSSAVPAATILSEGFDNVGALAGAGWVQTNVSTPAVGATNWYQGEGGLIPAHLGAANSYIAANFNNVADLGTIDNYLITPQLNTVAGTMLSFYTLSNGANTGYADRLRVLWSGNGASTAVGDFSTLLLDINPTLSTSTDPVTGYPNVWTNYSVIVPTGSGRLAFEYLVTSAGPSLSAINGDYIGIDTLSVDSPSLGDIPEPGSVVLLGGGLAALAWMRRRSTARG